MRQLTPYQVASIRMLSAGLVLMPFALKRRNHINRKRGYIILSGLLGSFIPAFLFCIAETRIDSALAGILNALTPICVIIVGALAFQHRSTRNQIVGVIIGFGGLLLLFGSSSNINFGYISYALLVLLATLSYGINVNMVNRVLTDIRSVDIAAFAFTSLIVPSALVLWFTGFFQLPLSNAGMFWSIGASALLGITGTAVATILFYVLLKKAGPIFSTMVTYGIPFVALLWGALTGESITILQIGCLILILGGVYVSRR